MRACTHLPMGVGGHARCRVRACTHLPMGVGGHAKCRVRACTHLPMPAGGWAKCRVRACTHLLTDGTPSVLNVGSPEVPLIIDKIVGVALSNPSAPGGYWIGGGKNMGSDARIGDTWFQSSATANGVSAADERSLLLLEATNGGAPGVQTVAWFVRAYQHYDIRGHDERYLRRSQQS